MSSRQENNLLSGDKTWEGHQTKCMSEYYSNLKSEAEQLGGGLDPICKSKVMLVLHKNAKTNSLGSGSKIEIWRSVSKQSKFEARQESYLWNSRKAIIESSFHKNRAWRFLFRGQTPPNCSLVLQICILVHSLGKYLKGLIWNFSAVIKDGGILSSCAKKNILGRHCLGDIVF